MAEIDLKNESKREFVDISMEQDRTYRVLGDEEIYISRPQWLHVSKSGHYVLDYNETMHFIPNGWIELSWRPKPGNPHIVA
jgi:hypothetical protein